MLPTASNDPISTSSVSESAPTATVSIARDKEEELLDTSPTDVPDGGLTAWLQVLGGFFLIFSTWYVQYWHALPIQLTQLLVGVSSTLSGHFKRITKIKG